MGLYQLIYQSQSLVPFEEPELRAMLQRSRQHNRHIGITGLLLYTPDGRFLQTLEGEEHAVRDLYFNHIALDPRHVHCRTLGEDHCRQRAFGDWAMGFRMAQAPDMRALLGHMPPNNPALLIPRPPTCPELVAMLTTFVLTRVDTEPWLEHPR